MTRDTDYRAEALSDAREMARNFLDEIIEQLREEGAASDDINNDYPRGDEYHHESHTDRYYDLLDAATLLDQLDEFEETDNGLWDGYGPRQAIACQAAYTYGNAVASMWSSLIGDINGDGEVQDILARITNLDDIDDEDAPPVDPSGAPMDQILCDMLLAEAPEVGDYAQDVGSKYAAQLAAGYLRDALAEALPLALRRAVSDVIDRS